MKQYIKWFAAIVIVGALAGCGRTAPIDQIYATVSPGYTQEQVKKAILIHKIYNRWVRNLDKDIKWNLVSNAGM